MRAPREFARLVFVSWSAGCCMLAGWSAGRQASRLSPASIQYHHSFIHLVPLEQDQLKEREKEAAVGKLRNPEI